MKYLFNIIACLFVASLIILSCTKSDEDSALNSAIFNRCKLLTYTYTMSHSHSVDSIFYNGNNISSVKGYQYYGSMLESTSLTKFEYTTNIIKVTHTYSTHSDIVFLDFKDSKLNQIKNKDGVVKASYYYSGDKLAYIFLGDPSGGRDSLAVTYDSSGKNIIEMGNYRYNPNTRKYVFSSQYKYAFDDKINPLYKSINEIYTYYDEYELSLNYFNTNNMVSETSIVSSSAWGSNGTGNAIYKYNEKNLPIELFGTDNSTVHISYSYNCN